MTGPSIIFYAIFGIPFLLAIYWILKQEKDRSKYVWGMVIFAIVVIAGIFFSYRGSRMAIQNFKQRQEDARRIEAEDSLEMKEADSTSIQSAPGK